MVGFQLGDVASYGTQAKNAGEKLPFDFSSPAINVLRNLNADSIVMDIVVTIKNPFDGTYQIAVGTPTDNQKYISYLDIDLTKPGIYIFDKFEKNGIAESLNVYFIGSATQGNGMVFFQEFD